MFFVQPHRHTHGLIATLLIAITVFFLQLPASAASLTFSFSLDAGYTTSAGAYKPDGTLVRTLWRKVYYPAGTHSYTWDGKDDSGADVAAGSYEFKILAHNIEYVWDGAIANTSQSQSGPGVHRSFYPVHDMAVSGQNAFYVAGYNEAGFLFTHFSLSNPKVALGRRRWVWNTSQNKVDNQHSNTADREWDFTATDGTRAYFGAVRGTDPTTRANTYPGFVTAVNVGDYSLAPFTNGVQIPEGQNGFPNLANGIYAGTQPGLSGLAVQSSGNLLAVSVRPDNKVYFFDKVSGAASGSVTVTTPGRIDFAPNGDLWVTSGTTVLRYTLSTSGGVWTLVTTISGFAKPLDVGVHPSNNNVVLVADGGSSQQIKAYTAAGAGLWTYGLAGGYATNGSVAANNKFYFNDGYKEDTFVAVQSDGSFWVGDGGNRRNLHFSSTRSYIEQLAYVPHNYSSSVDRSNPQRVFSEFLEFQVNYSQPAGTGWTLVRNWAAGLPPQFFTGFPKGLKQVTTFPNGRTYATAWDEALQKQMLVELDSTTNSTRVIAPMDWPGSQVTTISPNGDLIKLTPGTSSWTRYALTGFDASHNPQWSAGTNIGSASSGPQDPAPRCCGGGLIAAPITASDVIVSYDKTLSNGFHLGGVKVGGTSWLWKAMPTVTSNVPLDGLGSFDIGDGVTYAGNTAMAVGRNIVAGYHGEFWNATQAGQFMHFYDNGLFVGQFGVPGIGLAYTKDGIQAGFAGNGFSPSFVRNTDGELYVWTNDESGHGPQRWHLVGANNIREWSGSGTLGGATVGTTAAPAPFPTGIKALPGNGLVGLTWNPVAGATSYKVKYSTTDGGPYTVIPGIGGPEHVVGGLTNGTKYYFVVSAVVGGVESTNSEQTVATPFDPAVVVQTAGEQSTRDKIYLIKSSAPAQGQPALTGLNKLMGDLTLSNVGTRGYHIFDWGGPGVNNSNVLAPFSIVKGTGWKTDRWLGGDFRVDGVSSTQYGLYSDPTGYIDINVSDNNWHIVTAICMARFEDPRSFTIKLTPQGQTSPVASYTVNENPGRYHTYQFRFKGNVRLTVDSAGGALGTLRALFLDDAPVYSPPQIVGVGHYTAPNKDMNITYTVDSSAPANGQPALTGLPGVGLSNVGKKGYVVYNWGGSGVHNSNVLTPFSIGSATGFYNQGYLQNRFTIGGTAGSNWGLYSNPNGSIPITVSDSAVHTLTVMSAAFFADARTFTIKVTPQGQTSPSAIYTVANENPGKNHIFQFQFTGSIDLKVDTPTGWQQVGVVQALFLD